MEFISKPYESIYTPELLRDFIAKVFMFLNLDLIYPSLIAPIFNKFKKIDDIKLIDTVNDLSVKSNFKVDNIYVMDGSKRSKHSNAYFTGLF